METNVFLYFSAIEASDLLQQLSLDSQAKTIEITDATKKVFITDYYIFKCLYY